MTNYQRAKHIAELQVGIDEDVKWSVENLNPKELYSTAFAEGFMYCEGIHRKAFDSWKDTSVTQIVVDVEEAE